MPMDRRTLLAAAASTMLAAAIVPFATLRAETLARVDVFDRSAGEALLPTAITDANMSKVNRATSTPCVSAIARTNDCWPC